MVQPAALLTSSHMLLCFRLSIRLPSCYTLLHRYIVEAASVDPAQMVSTIEAFDEAIA